MEFTIDKDTFVKALQKIQGIVEKRNTMPILSNVLIDATDDAIQVTATDLEVGMRSSYNAKVSVRGSITVSAKKLYEIIRELPDENIRFSTRENDWVDIKCGKASFNLVGLSPDEFPRFPKVVEESFVRLGAPLLREMIEQTSYAICQDETKYNLNGIFVKAANEEGRNIIRMVATDGHRLSIAEREVEGAVPPELANGAIFPKKGVLELKKLADEGDGELLIGFMDNNAAIRKEQTVVVMRLVDGEFPDYTRVIPAQNDKEVTVNRDRLHHSLRRMAILSSERFKGIKFDINGSVMEISSSNPELGEAREELEVSYDGPALISRFNARYLIDVLNVLTNDNVVLKLRDEMSPALVTTENGNSFQAVIMPMRL